ncbi:Uncharacterized protein dnm_038810 [Desulfonema magnum]|uniref:Transmembrane protein n=1 Tax=Desulfonema magnum TaxID=45655 RepID=A0A975BLE0_9BACT|nr:Uncharacterized protein dnm_038810 [Desulfonema magnum]
MSDFSGYVKSGTGRFFLPRRHKVSRSLSVVPLCICVFVANFFGCVTDGAHTFFLSFRSTEFTVW